MAALVPGRTIMLEDGNEMAIMTGDRVPRRFNRAIKDAGYDRWYVVSYYDGARWRYNEDLPVEWHISRGTHKMDFVEEPAWVAVLVPVEYLSPEVNAFGEISP